MLQFAFLGSGSRGNALLVEGRRSRLLLDCGFSVREITARLACLDLSPSDLDAILLTHEHGDHASGVPRLARKHALPVFASYGTRMAVADEDGVDWRRITPEHVFELDDIAVAPVAVPHDAREPVQFVFEAGSARLGVLTDIGHITPHVVARYAGCHALVLETNHDPTMLAEGPYPPALKRRVGGQFGHLSNEQAGELLTRTDTARLDSLVAAHISEQNNTRELAQGALARAFGCNASEIEVAAQGEVGERRSVSA